MTQIIILILGSILVGFLIKWQEEREIDTDELCDLLLAMYGKPKYRRHYELQKKNPTND